MNMIVLGGQRAKTFQAQRLAQTKAQRPRRTWHIYGGGGNSVRRLLGAWEKAVGREARQITRALCVAPGSGSLAARRHLKSWDIIAKDGEGILEIGVTEPRAGRALGFKVAQKGLPLSYHCTAVT